VSDQSEGQDRSDFRRRAFAVVLFNLFPLALVLQGSWRAFDVVAFYWVEAIVAGVMATLQLFTAPLSALKGGRVGSSIGSMAALIGFPLHFGFFIVMSCFLVGTFLPADTAPRRLTSPFVPLEMVLDHIDFWWWFLLIALWEAAQFTYRKVVRQAQEPLTGSPVGLAYVRLFTMFTGAFFGVLLGMATDSRIWGAVVIVAVKMAVALAVAYGDTNRTRDGAA